MANGQRWSNGKWQGGAYLCLRGVSMMQGLGTIILIYISLDFKIFLVN